VVLSSEVIFIGLLPGPAREILPNMPFKKDQIVISMMAAVDIAELKSLVAKVDGNRVTRTVPLPSNSQRTGSHYSTFIEMCVCFIIFALIHFCSAADNSTQFALPHIAGPILLHPPNQEVQDILSIVGTPVVCHSEGESLLFLFLFLFLSL
jgi:hypothetical protein